MNDLPLEIPSDLSALPPVGMLTSGGIALDAMANVAQLKSAQAGWEAFHYEQISDTHFEITGGVAEIVGGLKKWAGAHSVVVITEAEILAEMQAAILAIRLATNLADAQSERASSAVLVHKPNAQNNSVSSAANSGASGKFLSVVLTLPDGDEARQRVLAAFQLQANVLGATVQACALHDTFSTRLN